MDESSLFSLQIVPEYLADPDFTVLLAAYRTSDLLSARLTTIEIPVPDSVLDIPMEAARRWNR